MLTIIIRAIIIYLHVLFVFRIMGKRQIGQMQPFELVLTLILADLATVPMSEINIPLLHGVVPLLTLLVLHFFLTLLSKLNPKISALFSGKPIIVINQNGIDYDSLKKLNISVEDLFESLREKGFFSFNDVAFAVMETNGKLSVLPKISSTPATKTDIIKDAQESKPQVEIVSEGKIVESNLEQLNLSKVQIINWLSRQRLSLKKLIVLTSDINGNSYFQEHNKKYQTTTINWESQK